MRTISFVAALKHLLQCHTFDVALEAHEQRTAMSASDVKHMNLGRI